MLASSLPPLVVSPEVRFPCWNLFLVLVFFFFFFFFLLCITFFFFFFKIFFFLGGGGNGPLWFPSGAAKFYGSSFGLPVFLSLALSFEVLQRHSTQEFGLFPPGLFFSRQAGSPFLF